MYDQPSEAGAETPRVGPVLENLSDCFKRAPQRGSRQQLRDMHAHLVRAHVEMAHQIMRTALVQLKACARSEAASEPVVASPEGEDQGWARGAERLRQLEEVQTDMAEQLDAALQMLRMAERLRHVQAVGVVHGMCRPDGARVRAGVCTASEHSFLQELSRWRSVFRTAPSRGEEVALRGRGGERGEQCDMAKRLHTCSVGRPLARVYHLGFVSMSSGIQKTGPPIMT